MPEVWWSCETEWDLLERVAMLKQWILARPEQTIAIVRPLQDVPPRDLWQNPTITPTPRIRWVMAVFSSASSGITSRIAGSRGQRYVRANEGAARKRCVVQDAVHCAGYDAGDVGNLQVM